VAIVYAIPFVWTTIYCILYTVCSKWFIIPIVAKIATYQGM